MKRIACIFLAGVLTLSLTAQPNKKAETNLPAKQDQIRPGTAQVLNPAGRIVYQYAVKVVQGVVTPETKPITIGQGVYFTKVNVHNPWNKPVKFWVKLVLSGPDGVQGPPPSAFHQFKLEPDFATEFSQEAFQQIFKDPLPRCFEGFLVIFTRYPLDVVSVYTGSVDPKQLATMYMERVQPREMTIKDLPEGLKMEE